MATVTKDIEETNNKIAHVKSIVKKYAEQIEDADLEQDALSSTCVMQGLCHAFVQSYFAANFGGRHRHLRTSRPLA